MCGITGFWRSSPSPEDEARATVSAMADAIRHRGPDASGTWIDGEAGLAFGHRRLSILDLSPAGAQPMSSASGRFVICFNGEIYNHLELRRELEAIGASPGWRGHSDTETLLAAIEQWGVERALQATCGMFALALWDRERRHLTLARDRTGEKPLYYGRAGNALIFASELKALRRFPGFDDALDPAALQGFVRLGYVPEPATIYASIRKLPPGCCLTLSAPDGQEEPQPYWSLTEVIRQGAQTRLDEPYPELCARVERCLGEVVASQMLSDVPLGCFLSGGIDSSLVAALMRRASEDVRSFSIGFEAGHFDEASHAREVAARLGTRHTEFVVTEADALAVVPDLPRIYDEPFADSSQIPTTLLARLARQDVTVALTGDGGDEVFGGYNRHLMLPRIWRALRPLPRPGRRALGGTLAVLQRAVAGDGRSLHRAVRALRLPLTTFDKLGRLGEAIANARDYSDFYRTMVSAAPNAASMLAGPDHEWRPPSLDGCEPAEWTMAMDTLEYLPGDILVKVDRASMNASLETRAPFLDRRVVELAWRLPISSKIAPAHGKRILRDMLSRHVPRELIDRPKQGFAIPLDQWLRGALRDWAEAQLAPDRLSAGGVVDADHVGRLWEDHVRGRANAGPQLWNVLMLQSWLEHQTDEKTPRARS